MPELNGICVHVASEQGELQDLKVTYENEYTVSCYIGSVVGAQFLVDYCIDPELDEDVTVKTAVDGTDHDYTLDRSNDRDGRIHHVEGRLERGGVLRPFCFAPLTQIDEEDGDMDMDFEQREDVLSSLGTIELIVRRCAYRGHVDGDLDRLGHETNSKVREKDLKLGDHMSHVAGLSPPKKTRKVSLHSVIETDTLQHPYARFIFRYRSRSNLESLSVVDAPVADVLFFEQAARRLSYLHMNGEISDYEYENASKNLSTMGIDDMVWT